MKPLHHILIRWRMVAVLVSAAMLATAHAFQRFGGLDPCLLCLRQREVSWTALGLAAAFMVLVRMPGGPRWREATCWVLGVVFLVGAGIAAFHAGAEWKFWPGPDACAAAPGAISAQAMDAFLKGAQMKAPRCDEAAWIFAGLSMAGWNAVISLAMAVLSALAALREREKL